MKVLVCGSRHFNDYKKLSEELDKLHTPKGTPGGHQIDEIIHGAARGADTLAGRYGAEHNIPVRTFPALWDLHGKRAGPIRNSQMLTEGKPGLVLAFLAPDSRGTKNMIDQATKAGKPVQVVLI